MKKRWFLWTVILFTSLLFIYGCGKEGKHKQTAQELIDQGWAKFATGNFTGASADFNAANGLTTDTTEAYLGLGWAELRRNNAGLAEKAFVTYLAKVSDSNDAKAGLALAYDAQDKFQNAISMAEEVLQSAPTWMFSHDPKINHLDLAYVLADSYYSIANFSQSLVTVQHYFNLPDFKPDINTDQGRTELANKIEELYQQVV